jgi:hypothetical protein
MNDMIGCLVRFQVVEHRFQEQVSIPKVYRVGQQMLQVNCSFDLMGLEDMVRDYLLPLFDCLLNNQKGLMRVLVDRSKATPIGSNQSNEVYKVDLINGSLLEGFRNLALSGFRQLHMPLMMVYLQIVPSHI